MNFVPFVAKIFFIYFVVVKSFYEDSDVERQFHQR